MPRFLYVVDTLVVDMLKEQLPSCIVPMLIDTYAEL
jgi:hypothetical protein